MLLDEDRDAAWMQAVAAELAQPTTAFLHGRALRWFTPVAELAMCGHATLATTHVLHETGGARAGEPLRFDTPHGPIGALREDGRCWVTFPAGRLDVLADPAPAMAAVGLEGDPAWAGVGDAEQVLVLDAPETVVALAPDTDAIRSLPTPRLIVTAAGGTDGVDCTSRVFLPRDGIDEDAVTGSAHAVLGPLWAQRLGRRELRARQASARGGELTLRVDGDVVHLGGTAVTVSRGELLL